MQISSNIHISLLFKSLCVCDRILRYADLHVSRRQTIVLQHIQCECDGTYVEIDRTPSFEKHTHIKRSTNHRHWSKFVKVVGWFIICVTKTSLRTCDRLKYKSLYIENIFVYIIQHHKNGCLERDGSMFIIVRWIGHHFLYHTNKAMAEQQLRQNDIDLCRKNVCSALSYA